MEPSASQPATIRGLRLLHQQYSALTLKNLLLTWRHKRSAALQLLSSLFFLFLIFCIQKATQSRFSSTTRYKNVVDPDPLVSPPIPPCEDKFFVRTPCIDFAWSGNASRRVGGIVSKIMVNNPGRPIPPEKVKSFSTPDEVDAWLESNPMRCPGALHFVERNSTVISYGIQTNSTPVAKRGNYEDPTFKFQVPLQIAAEREIARSLLGDPNFSWVVGLKEFAHPAVDTFSAVGTAGPTFFLAIAMFGFVFQVSSLITEKELKLRQAMSIMGLYDTAYWMSWLTWEAFLTLLSSLFSVLFGMMFQFDFFLNNNFGVLFLVFFLFQFNMIGFAFMISTFISKSSSATTVGFSVFIIGFLTQDDIYKWLISTFFLWFFLAIYLDNIIPNSYGVRKPFFYFLKPSYWTGKGGNKVEEGGICSCIGSIPPLDDVPPDDEDVFAEETVVKRQATENMLDPSIAVQIRGVTKTYPGTTKMVGCCKCKKSAAYHAVRVAAKSLAEVKLTEAAKMRAGSYSGGMKRRLSVAIALIGDPKLVFLDEPTTGMDPITRRHVWDIIEDAKKGRAIILTTHSMEEADILSDRIAIMAKGKLRCIGTSIRLKSKFGTGYITNVSFLGNTPGQTPNNYSNGIPNEPHLEPVKEFFKNRLGVVPKEENKAFLTFVIPHEKEGLLTEFFAELQDRERELGISDIQLGLTTLEEVFLNIARQAELENASIEGSLVTLDLLSGNSIQIPRGARFIGIPGTESAENPRGLMVEVYWEQDDSGSLCISGHSPETPIPPNIQLQAPLNSASRRGFLSGNAPVLGLVIDPHSMQTLNGR
ncbi:ABC transporter A family member 2 [Acorus calamus]|uniref:ABC transporter A family member 2 n=1 Tax=Acorus calamus TaxID=4465 RepID=A0AAV9EFY2_ACOCL|nr:ABC transporter A family member 2 [Acorus calamus]